jgi:two-component sensor histidine kinase
MVTDDAPGAPRLSAGPGSKRRTIGAAASSFSHARERIRGRIKSGLRQLYWACLEPEPPPWRSIAVGLGFFAASTGLRLLFHAQFGQRYSFITYFLAVSLASGAGGFLAGFVALVACTVTAWSMFMPAHAGGLFANSADSIALAMFVFTSGVEGAIAAALRGALIRLNTSDQNLRLLTNELDHRVRNSLATVLAIARQTARHTQEFEAFDAAFQSRIQAMAKAHEILTRSRWRDADIRDVLQIELSMWGSRVVLEGEDLMLPARAVLSLSMIIHELATNAAKYGALSGPGVVKVSWWCEPGPKSAKGCVEWCETGGPPVPTPTRKGFGSTLIHRLAQTELGGEARVEYRAEGLVAQFEFPLPGAAVHRATAP